MDFLKIRGHDYNKDLEGGCLYAYLWRDPEGDHYGFYLPDIKAREHGMLITTDKVGASMGVVYSEDTPFWQQMTRTTPNVAQMVIKFARIVPVDNPSVMRPALGSVAFDVPVYNTENWCCDVLFRFHKAGFLQLKGDVSKEGNSVAVWEILKLLRNAAVNEQSGIGFASPNEITAKWVIKGSGPTKALVSEAVTRMKVGSSGSSRK